MARRASLELNAETPHYPCGILSSPSPSPSCVPDARKIALLPAKWAAAHQNVDARGRERPRLCTYYRRLEVWRAIREQETHHHNKGDELTPCVSKCHVPNQGDVLPRFATILNFDMAAVGKVMN